MEDMLLSYVPSIITGSFILIVLLNFFLLSRTSLRDFYHVYDYDKYKNWAITEIERLNHQIRVKEGRLINSSEDRAGLPDKDKSEPSH